MLASKAPDAPVKLTDFGLAVNIDNGPVFFGIYFDSFVDIDFVNSRSNRNSVNTNIESMIVRLVSDLCVVFVYLVFM